MEDLAVEDLTVVKASAAQDIHDDLTVEAQDDLAAEVR